MSAYEGLQQLPRYRAVEILAEWEMFDRFGRNAEQVWANEWGRAVSAVQLRHINHWFRPRANDDQMRFAIWDRIKREEPVFEDGLRALCPYECEEHMFPANEKGVPIAYV